MRTLAQVDTPAAAAVYAPPLQDSDVIRSQVVRHGSRCVWQVTVDCADGRSRGPLRHVVKHSPDGFSWGYNGSGPSDLARSLLLAVLGAGVLCVSCGGTAVIAHEPGSSRPVRYDPARHRPTMAAPCGCGDGLVVPAGLDHELRAKVVARWPIDADWSVTVGALRAWCTQTLAADRAAPGDAVAVG